MRTANLHTSLDMHTIHSSKCQTRLNSRISQKTQNQDRSETRQRGSRGSRHNSASMSGSQLSISKIQYKLLSNEISERFPVPVRLAFQSNLTAWLHQNLSKRFLNTSTELASTTQSGKLFHIFTTLGVNEYLRTSNQINQSI